MQPLLDLTTAPFDVLVLLASATRLEAMSEVLADLSIDLPSAVLLVLSQNGAAWGDQVGQRVRRPVHSAEDGVVLQRGRLYVHPPNRVLEVRPDGRCTVSTPTGELSAERPHDRLLASLAISFGSRVLVVILDGEGQDGVAGACALHGTGGTVLVQRPEASAYGGLPDAVIGAGAADSVLSLQSLGQTMTDLLEGKQLSRGEAKQVEAEQALCESELRHQLTAEVAGLGTYVWHVQEDRSEPDARLLQMCGLEGSATVSLSSLLSHLVHPDDRRAYENAARAALDTAGNGNFFMEARFVHPGGVVHWLAVSGRTVFEGEPRQAVRIYGTVADIDERKRCEVNSSFLAEVNADLLEWTDIDETMAALSAKLGAHFDVAVCAFTDIDAAGLMVFKHGWHRANLPASQGRHCYQNVYTEDFRRMSRAGEMYVVHDGGADPRVDSANMAAISVGAYVNVPLVRGGEWLFNLTLYSSVPRNWRDDELAMMRELTDWIWTHLARARAEEALREHGARHTFLLQLSDALRPLAHPVIIQTTANRMLGEYLNIDHAYYVETDETTQEYVVTCQWHRSGAPSSSGRYPMSTWKMPWVMGGNTWILQDVNVDCRLPDEQRVSYRRHDIAAAVVVPLLKESQLVATLVTNQSQPRAWTVHEVALVEEVAQRTWAAVQWGQAEEALRTLNFTLEERVEERTRRLAALTQQLQDQNTKLIARTQTLEAFLQLTRNLTLETDRYALVQQVQQTLLKLLPPAHTSYFELETNMWRMKSEAGNLRNPALREMLNAGLPRGSPGPFVPFLTGRPEYQNGLMPGQDTPAELSRHIQTAALPILLGGMPIGVLAVGRFDPQPWQPVDKVVLETAAQALSLALERAGAVQALKEEREALAAFVQFTEWTTETSDVGLLAQRASQVLHATLNVGSAVYFESQGGLWKARYICGTLAPQLEHDLREGLPLGAPSFALPADQREAMFFEPWNAAADGLPEAGGTQIAARYPLFPQDHPVGMLSMVSPDAPVWTDREKAVFRAVGDSLRLALERAATVQQIERQHERLADLNAELGNFITRTAHNLEEPARQLGHLLDSGYPDEMGLPPYDPVALKDEVARLKGVAQDLRQLAKVERHALAKELLPLRELFVEMSTSSPDDRVSWHLSPLPIVRGDRALLRQALKVLLTFVLSESRGTRYVTISSREVEGEVQIMVEDDGMGLTGEEAATLFDLAVRTDQSVPVLEGSGLVQVRRILARHGGWAWAEAQLSSGKVVLAFPQDEAVNEVEALFQQERPGS